MNKFVLFAVLLASTTALAGGRHSRDTERHEDRHRNVTGHGHHSHGNGHGYGHDEDREDRNDHDDDDRDDRDDCGEDEPEPECRDNNGCLPNEECIDNVCVIVPECDCDADCTDGLFCTGDDYCLRGECVTLPRECRPGEVCDEDADSCVLIPECDCDADCDNDLFCDGAETCQNSLCLNADSPCNSHQSCDEENDVCTDDSDDDAYPDAPIECQGEGEGEPAEGEGEGEGEPSEGEGEGEVEPAEGEGEKDNLNISGSAVWTCQSSSAPSLLLFALIVPAFAFLSRRRAALAVIFMLATSAQAESLDRVIGPVVENDTLHTSSPSLIDEDKMQASVSLDYAHQPIVFRDSTFARRFSVTDHEVTGRANFAYGLLDSLQLEASVPVTFAIGEGLRLDNVNSIGFADSLIGARLAVTNPDDIFQAAFSLRLGLPGSFLGVNSQPILGEALPTLTPALLFSVGDDVVRFTSNIGYVFRQPKTVADVTIGHQVVGAAGLQIQLVPDALWAVSDATVAISGPALFSNRMMAPAEVAVGLRGRQNNIFASLEVGTGLVADVGIPNFRALASVGVNFGMPPTRVTVAENQPEEVKNEPAPPVVITVQRRAEPELATLTNGKIVLLRPVFFKFDSEHIRPESIAVILQVGDILLAHPEIELVSIEGHTSSEGTTVYNLNLSQKRASAVKSFLIEYGIEERRLQALGLGEEIPLVSNQTEAGRQTNRRVEFVIISSR